MKIYKEDINLAIGVSYKKNVDLLISGKNVFAPNLSVEEKCSIFWG